MAKKGKGGKKKLMPTFIKSNEAITKPQHTYKDPLTDKQFDRAREATDQLLCFFHDTYDNIKIIEKVWANKPQEFAMRHQGYVDASNKLFRDKYNIQPTTLTSFLARKAEKLYERDSDYTKALSAKLDKCLTFLAVCQVGLNVEQSDDDLLYPFENSILERDSLLDYLDQTGLKDMQYDDEYLYVNEGNEMRLAFILTHAYPTLTKLVDPVHNIVAMQDRILTQVDKDIESYENKQLQHLLTAKVEKEARALALA